MDTFYPAPDDPERIAKLYAEHGAHAPGTRIWRDGVDVTDEPDKWPDYAKLAPGERISKRAKRPRKG